MPAQRVHLIAPAGSCRRYVMQMGCTSAAELCALYQEWLGPPYKVTASEPLILADEDEADGGRNDDLARAHDVTDALRDDTCAAMIALRGGAWFTRVLPHIDFSVLDRRAHPIHVLGFSELTTLVNLAAAHPMGRGVHDLGPAFLAYALKHQALRELPEGPDLEDRATAYWQAHLRPATKHWLTDVRSIAEGGASARPLCAELLAGRLDPESPVCFVGGNLTVLSTMVGTPYEKPMFDSTPAALWLFLEDYNDKLERFDRFLAHFTLAGWWERFSGLVLGDFHHGPVNLIDHVLRLLHYHLPSKQKMPILSCLALGHVWPMSPLPLRTSGWWQRGPHASSYTLVFPESRARA